MNKKSKIFLIIFSVILVAVVMILFFRIYVLKDYVIQMEVECDPETEHCFIYECDAEFDEECPENPEERVSYFKVLERKAHDIAACDENDLDCGYECNEGEYCNEVLCDEVTAVDFGECSDPKDFLSDESKEVSDI